MPYRNYLVITAIMLILVGLGYWGYDSSVTPGQPGRKVAIREGADYFLTGADISQFDIEGKRQYTLVSDSITHYPHNDTTLLQKPQMTSYNNPGEVFRSVSEHGKLLPGNTDIELWDDVVMTQTEVASNKVVRMSTDFITIYSEKELADTDRPVLITSPTSVTRAIGMSAWYKQGLVKLKSRVRGVHEPE